MKYFKIAFSACFVIGLGLACAENPDHNDHDKHDEHDEHDSDHSDSAVRAADRSSGIELAPAAILRLGIQSTPLRHFKTEIADEFSIPYDALILFENESQIFCSDPRTKRLRPVAIRVLNAAGGRVRIKLIGPTLSDLPAGAALITHNAPLVRLAYLEAFGASGTGHGH